MCSRPTSPLSNCVRNLSTLLNLAVLEKVAIANALQLYAARRRTVHIRSNFLARDKFELAQPIHAVLEHFYSSYVTLCCDLDLWPWTCVVDRLRHGQTLYEIWVKTNNPRRSYCDLNIWPYDLEHVSRAQLCCGIVCTKFKLSQAIRPWNITIFSCQYVMSRYDLDLWPVNIENLW